MKWSDTCFSSTHVGAGSHATGYSQMQVLQFMHNLPVHLIICRCILTMMNFFLPHAVAYACLVVVICMSFLGIAYMRVRQSAGQRMIVCQAVWPTILMSLSRTLSFLYLPITSATMSLFSCRSLAVPVEGEGMQVEFVKELRWTMVSAPRLRHDVRKKEITNCKPKTSFAISGRCWYHSGPVYTCINVLHHLHFFSHAFCTL